MKAMPRAVWHGLPNGGVQDRFICSARSFFLVACMTAVTHDVRCSGTAIRVAPMKTLVYLKRQDRQPSVNSEIDVRLAS